MHFSSTAGHNSVPYCGVPVLLVCSVGSGLVGFIPSKTNESFAGLETFVVFAKLVVFFFERHQTRLDS